MKCEEKRGIPITFEFKCDQVNWFVAYIFCAVYEYHSLEFNSIGILFGIFFKKNTINKHMVYECGIVF